MNAADTSGSQTAGSHASSLARLSCLHDYEAAARAQLPAEVWAYLHAGAADGVTQAWNARAFDQWALWPRVLRRVAGGNMAVELFGVTHPQPILIAPTAYHALANREAERATALAAAAMQTGYVVSTLSSVSLEEIAAVYVQTHAQALREAAPADRITTPPLWFQLYLQPQREVSLDLLRRAEAAGYQAIVITVDAPIQGLRSAEQRLGFQMPPDVQAVNLARYDNHASNTTNTTLPPGASMFQHPLVTHMASWDDLVWLIKHARIPVLVKGILHPADVAPALDAGAAGLIVSNHGGRALDTVVAALDALPAIVTQVQSRVPVLMDGGVRRGTDVLKALALGASAVLIGRPILHGLAVAGATGVAHVLNLLRSELAAAMVLTGCQTLADVTTELCVQRQQSRATNAATLPPYLSK